MCGNYSSARVFSETAERESNIYRKCVSGEEGGLKREKVECRHVFRSDHLHLWNNDRTQEGLPESEIGRAVISALNEATSTDYG